MEGKDAMLGSNFRMDFTVTVAELGRGTRLAIRSEVAVFGKIAALGLPIIRRKADGLMREFAVNIGRVLEARQPGEARV
jgi:carbon monoxide dehydrogenase subunit G